MNIKIDSLIPKYDKIIIGCSLESLLYSYFYNIPFVYNQKIIPHEFDEFDSNLPQFPETNSKLELWNKLFFILSIKGLSLMPFECSSISIQKDDHLIKCPTEHGRLAKFQYNEIIIFDDYKILNLPTIKSTNILKYKVLDFINIRRGAIKNCEILETKENLVSKIIFYTSRRSFWKNESHKDIMCISYLNEEELNDYENSDIAVRFKAKFVMEQNGIKGVEKGTAPIKLENDHRILIQLNKKNEYNEISSIKFNYQSFDIISNDAKDKHIELEKTLKVYETRWKKRKYLKAKDIDTSLA